MRRLTIVAVALLTTLLMATPAQAVDEVNTKRLRNAVTVNGILGHERVFQRIANQNGGTRASGTPGYDASAAYVAGRLEAAGYEVTMQEFIFPFFRELAPAVLDAGVADPDRLRDRHLHLSGSGEVTGPLFADQRHRDPADAGAELDLRAASRGTSRPPRPEPAVALIQRGTCTFEVKAANAQAAGYDAVIIFNEGQPGRDELFIGTLGRPFDHPGGRAELRRRRRPVRAARRRPGGRARGHRDRDRPGARDGQHPRRLADRRATTRWSSSAPTSTR